MGGGAAGCSWEPCSRGKPPPSLLRNSLQSCKAMAPCIFLRHPLQPVAPVSFLLTIQRDRLCLRSPVCSVFRQVALAKWTPLLAFLGCSCVSWPLLHPLTSSFSSCCICDTLGHFPAAWAHREEQASPAREGWGMVSMHEAGQDRAQAPAGALGNCGSIAFSSTHRVSAERLTRGGGAGGIL